MASPAESGVVRTYIETMLEMPWNKKCEENLDIKAAKEKLDEEHYGLEKVKERNFRVSGSAFPYQKGTSPIICWLGPRQGNRVKNFHCKIGGKGVKQEICSHQPWWRER